MRAFLLLILIITALSPFSPSMAEELQADQTAARILVYFMVGRDDLPHVSVTADQFKSHMKEFKDGGYHVASLTEIFDAYDNNKPLPDKTVAITFDGGDKSIMDHAIPLLDAYQFPYTLFIDTVSTDKNNHHNINWNDLKTLSKSKLINIGYHTDKYKNSSFETTDLLVKSINNASYQFRENLGISPQFFAYPFGLYDQATMDVLTRYDLKAAFGQQSSVAHAGSNRLAIPRFTMSEDYADLDRFRMIINALPFDATDITPITSIVNGSRPAIGFTVKGMKDEDLKRLSCFASNQDKPDITILENRVELRLKSDLNTDRLRVNCTLPVSQEKNIKTKTWRWLGFLFERHDTAQN